MRRGRLSAIWESRRSFRYLRWVPNCIHDTTPTLSSGSPLVFDCIASPTSVNDHWLAKPSSTTPRYALPRKDQKTRRSGSPLRKRGLCRPQETTASLMMYDTSVNYGGRRRKSPQESPHEKTLTKPRAETRRRRVLSFSASPRLRAKNGFVGVPNNKQPVRFWNLPP